MVLNSELDSHQHSIQIFCLPQHYLVFQNVLCSICSDKETIISLSENVSMKLGMNFYIPDQRVYHSIKLFLRGCLYEFSQNKCPHLLCHQNSRVTTLPKYPKICQCKGVHTFWIDVQKCEYGFLDADFLILCWDPNEAKQVSFLDTCLKGHS
mgnify:CR=1 FL=1